MRRTGLRHGAPPAPFLRLLQRDVHAIGRQVECSPPVCDAAYHDALLVLEIGDRAPSMIVSRLLPRIIATEIRAWSNCRPRLPR